MVSGAVVGTISTAIWLPLRRCRSCSREDCAAMSLLDKVFVMSTTRPVSCGTATSARAACVQHSKSARTNVRAADITRKRLISGLFGAEIDLRRRGDFLLVLDREVRLLLVAEHHRRQIVREGADADVIILHRLDVAVARHGDAVLGAFKLRHQVVE